jgi:prophage regulatory protein
MITDTPATNVRLLPLAAVLAEFKLHKTTVYGLIKRGMFPRPIKVGGSSRWLADEIENYKAECRAKGRGPTPRRADSFAA